jgi:hypothetical protein
MMTTSNHDNRRQVQRDARLWAELTGTNYTTALREVGSPLTQGILGERITVAQLIQALDRYPTLGDSGVGSSRLFRNADGTINGGVDLITDVILAVEFLRMFSPATDPESKVSSYGLKHVAEKLLKPARSYISNGQMIWAAAAIGLPISRLERGNLNVEIAVPDLEYNYASGVARGSSQSPKAHDHQPPRFRHLRDALDEFEATGAIAATGEDLMSLQRDEGDMRFHNWLVSQAGRGDSVGSLATDYDGSIVRHEDPIVRSPADLLKIMDTYQVSDDVLEAANKAIAEWRAVSRSAGNAQSS